jgi:hypothetical protein
VPDHKHVDTLTVPIISAKQPLLYSANPLLIFSMVDVPFMTHVAMVPEKMVKICRRKIPR